MKPLGTRERARPARIEAGGTPALPGLEQLADWTTEKQIELTRIPAPTGQEQARAHWFRGQFEAIGLEKVRLDECGNVLGEISGAEPRVVVVTAHLDTVFTGEIRQDNGRLYGPGVTDNGAGLAALLAVARASRESGVSLKHSLVFAANVGEEGEGNLRGMRHLMEVFGAVARAVLVLDGAGVDHITTQALGSRRFLVTVEGPGGHSWSDFGTVNPIHALAAAITRLAHEEKPDGTTCNIGQIQAGSSVNSIPSMAEMKVDIRSGSAEEIERWASLVAETVRAAVADENRRASRGSLIFHLRQIGDRPAAALREDAPILRIIKEVDRSLGITATEHQSSTDANVPLALGIEAVTVGAGGQGGGTHSPLEWYDPADRILGLKRILLTLLRLARL